MKRFLIFGGYRKDLLSQCGVTNGGWIDLLGQYDNMAQVHLRLYDWKGSGKWYHVVDSTTGKIFMES
jgi:hypothetical protein